VARHHWAANEKEMESMRENAKREAAQAVDQAKRAMKDKEWALKEDGKPKGPKELKDSTDGPRRELDQMRKQHDLLQQEIRKLEREIRQLERDRKQLDERRSEDEPSGDNQPLRKK
jgi:chromosome segregation ATPase